jgi:ArsR family transcriptional regulator
MKDQLNLFKALGDETRLKIVEFLLDGEKCVCEIFPHVKRTQSTVSIQLGKLENLGILTSRRDGKKIYYKISNEKVRKMMNIC